MYIDFNFIYTTTATSTVTSKDKIEITKDAIFILLDSNQAHRLVEDDDVVFHPIS